MPTHYYYLETYILIERMYNFHIQINVSKDKLKTLIFFPITLHIKSIITFSYIISNFQKLN